jgi:hypothetical protein
MNRTKSYTDRLPARVILEYLVIFTYPKQTNNCKRYTLVSILNEKSTLFSELPNILAALIGGGYKVKPTWMTSHIDLANLHYKSKYLVASS